MSGIERFLLWLIGALLLAAAVPFWRLVLSPEARERRRRERSHRPVISTAHRPMVRLAVETKKSESERKG
jgi:hypothetical protein